ncbi:hypothetical protein QAD02_006568 [Eretmocerus hayati]|uniref:Uncharacterized protein n=1 Tax=Eretmocerus hayati TaxID=131215 RepID=A0ACC2N232_9HYME|nr:hypothetical protein QAD02_006568 [Eretmocerus hayati]
MKFTNSIFITAIVLFICCIVDAKYDFNLIQQSSGYVEVRTGAKMFWLLMNAEAKNYREKPLIVYLQGGPGTSATGYENFVEIGPLDENLERRNNSWVKDHNLLFIDSPVGTGFSYVEKIEDLATNNAQIVKDLMKLISTFYADHSEFSNVPTYIFSESYGGKVAVELALQWYKDQESKTIKSDLRGVGLGNPWIAPIDIIQTWPSYLLQMGFIDTQGAVKIENAVNFTKQAIKEGRWSDATDRFIRVAKIARAESKGINLYNILTQVSTERMNDSINSLKFMDEPVLSEGESDTIGSPALHALMNGEVKKIVHGAVEWVAFNKTIFDTLKSDFMRPVTGIVEQLLNETKLKISVYTGQLDFIVDTPGTLHWSEKLNWRDSDGWRAAKREVMISNGIIEGFYKTYNRFSFYWVNRAGHRVQSENPEAMSIILKDMTMN